MSTVTLFIIVKLWNQPRRSTRDEQIKAIWYIWTTEYYSSIMKNEILSTKCSSSKINGTQRHVWILLFLWGLSKVYLVVEFEQSNVVMVEKWGCIDQCVWLGRCWKPTQNSDIWLLHVNQQCKRLYFQASLISWLWEGSLNMKSTRKHEQEGQHPLLSMQLPFALISLNLTFATGILFSSGRSRGRMVSPQCQNREWWQNI